MESCCTALLPIVLHHCPCALFGNLSSSSFHPARLLARRGSHILEYAAVKNSATAVFLLWMSDMFGLPQCLQPFRIFLSNVREPLFRLFSLLPFLFSSPHPLPFAVQPPSHSLSSADGAGCKIDPASSADSQFEPASVVRRDVSQKCRQSARASQRVPLTTAVPAAQCRLPLRSGQQCRRSAQASLSSATRLQPAAPIACATDHSIASSAVPTASKVRPAVPTVSSRRSQPCDATSTISTARLWRLLRATNLCSASSALPTFSVYCPRLSHLTRARGAHINGGSCFPSRAELSDFVEQAA